MGDGPEHSDLVSLAKTLGVMDHVAFHGSMIPAEVAEILRHSDLLLSTSEAETFGISMIEGMACGLPVVSSPSHGPGDFVTEEYGVISDSLSVEALADCVRSTMSRSFDSTVIAERTAERFSSKVVSHQIHAVYKKLLSS